MHVPGKIHIGPDTLSRREVTAAMVNLFADDAADTWERTRDLEAGIEATVVAAIPHPISWQQVRDAVAKNEVMAMLTEQISNGFPPDKKLLRIELREFYQHREFLTQVDGVPLYKDRVIIPAALGGGGIGDQTQCTPGCHRDDREGTEECVVAGYYPPDKGDKRQVQKLH